jgi:hypothetical protein
MNKIEKLFGVVVTSAMFTMVGCAPADDAEVSEDVSALAQEAGGVDLTGTWGVAMTASSEMTAPLIGKSASKAALTMRFYVSKEGEQYRADVQICRLNTDSATVKIDYVNVLPQLKTSIVVPTFEPAIGGKVPFPNFVFRVGQDQAGASIDADRDGKPGATTPVVALGLLSINAYAGFELKVSLDALLKDAGTIQGGYSFGAVGKVFGSNSPLLPPGELRVTQTQPNASYTAKRFDGDIPCAELVKKL